MYSDPTALGSIPSIPENFSEEQIVDVAEFIKWRCLEKSGHGLENVEQNHLGLSSGKLELQKAALLATMQLDTHQASPKKFETKSEMLGERKVPRFSWNVVNLEQMSLSSEAAKNFLASASLLKKGLKNKHNFEQKI